MSDLLFMGGYATYVWSAYGVAAFGMAAIAYATSRRLCKMRREAANLDADEP